MSSASIMIVDDDVNLSSSMKLILKYHGYEVIVANGGPEALELAKEIPRIDIVFMDIKMPEMNGVEAYTHLKRIIPEVIVIMMTAYAVEELIQEAIELGAYRIFYKPLDMDEVLSLIAAV